MNADREHVLACDELRVRFAFRADRFAHDIWVAQGASWVQALSSVEGSAAENWPASPPLQTLHVESRPDGSQLALLVGMAGQSHWSASVALDPLTPRLHFDIACRVRSGAAQQLGNRYRTAWPLAAMEPERASFLAADPSGRPANVGLSVALDERLGDARLESTPDGIVIIVNAPNDRDANSTIRWGYRVAVEPINRDT